VLIHNERVRQQPAADAQGERELLPGAQIRVLRFEGAWAVIAVDGQIWGYVPADALAPLH
jgi:hypothetical protein